MALTRCTGCGKATETTGSADTETWHEKCYQQHRKREPRCEEHVICKRAKGVE